jgi:hypothetical protein
MRATCSAYLILLDLITVQIVKVTIMQSSPASRHFLPLKSKCYEKNEFINFF